MGEEVNINKLAWDTLKADKPEMEQLFINGLSRMHELFVQKNNDYGTDNIFIGGVDGVVMRMGDKINRLWQMVILKKPMEYRWETVKDTLLDLANYCLLALIAYTNPQYKPTIDRKVTTAAYIRSLPKEEKAGIIKALLENMDE